MYTSKLYVVMWLRKSVLIRYRIPSLLYTSNITIIYHVKFFGLDLVVFDLPDSSSTRGVLRATPPDKPKGCTCDGQNTIRVLVAIAMSDSLLIRD
jgi:hypothetical protein